MPMSPRLLRPRASGATHPEALDWATRVTANGGTFSSSTLAAVSAFCSSITAAGIRDRFYRLNLFCGDQLAAALVPLYRAESLASAVRGNATDTNNGPFVDADFNNTGSSSGLKGNGSSKFLNTGYPANTLAATNTHMAIGLLATETVANADKTALGAYDTGGQFVYTIDLRRPNAAAVRLCGMGSYAAGGPGFFGEAGTSSSMAIGNIAAVAGKQYRAAVEVGTTATAIANYPQAHSLYLFASNNGAGGGAAANHTNARLGSYSLGAAMTVSQLAAYDAALSAFNSTLSRT